MTELVVFLRARLDEDAQRASDIAGDERHQRWALHESADYNETFIVEDALWHVRDVAAKRAIVDRCAKDYDEPTSGGAVARVTLHQLAAVYNRHPDYRQEWKPARNA